MSTFETWFVTADHVHPDYRFRDEPVRVTRMSDGYFADHRKLGCGKTFDTAEHAIDHLFRDHACTTIRIRRVAE